MRAGFEGGIDAPAAAIAKATGGVAELALSSDREKTADGVFDDSVAAAVAMLVDAEPSLLDSPPEFSYRLGREQFVEHLLRMVAEVDARDYRKLPQEALAAWAEMSVPSCRALLGRHPLIPKVQPVRAALELSGAEAGAALAGVIKLYPGARNTQLKRRGVHRPAGDGTAGRQLHLEFVVVTDAGRTVLVNTERFGVDDVLRDGAAAAGVEALREARLKGVTAPLVLEQIYRDAVGERLAASWGRHRRGVIPQTVADHVEALVAEAVDAAELAGCPDLYTGLPVVGGQLVAATPLGTLPAQPDVPLVGHDLASVERLIDLGLQPVLDLNYVSEVDPRAVAKLPFEVEVLRESGDRVALTGTSVLAAASDPKRAELVSRDQLGVRARFRLAVNYLDGTIRLPSSGLTDVRIYYRAGPQIPHNLYLAPGVSADDGAPHDRALAAVVADSTDLHAGKPALMPAARDALARKGGLDPGGGEAAYPTESLGALGRLAADRELHRRFAEGALRRSI